MARIAPATKWMRILTSIGALYLESSLHGAVVPIVAEWDWSATDVKIESQTNESEELETRASFAIGAIFLGTGLTEVMLAPFAGMVADKCGFDVVILAGLLVGVLKCLLFGCLGTSIWTVSINRILQGVLSACTQSIAIARIVDVYAKPSQECVNVLALAMCKLAFSFISALFVGELYKYINHRVFLLYLPISLLLFIGIMITFRADNFHSIDESNSELREQVSSSAVWRRVVCDIQLLIMSICFGLANLGQASFEPSVAVWMKSTFGVGPDTIGLILGLCAAATITGSVVAAQISSPKEQNRVWIVFMATLCLTGIPLLLVNFSPGIFAAGACLCIHFLFATTARLMLLSMCATLATRRYPTTNGLVFAIFNVGWSGSFFLGPLLSPFLFGSTCLICATGAACIVISSLSVFLRQLEANKGPNLMDCCPTENSGYMMLPNNEKIPFTFETSKETLQPCNESKPGRPTCDHQ